MEDLRTKLERMSPYELSLYKQQLRQHYTDAPPQDRDALLFRMRDFPQLTDLSQELGGMPAAEVPLWKKGLEYGVGALERAFYPFALTGMTTRQIPQLPELAMRRGEFEGVPRPTEGYNIWGLPTEELPPLKERWGKFTERLGEVLPGGREYEEYREIPLWQQMLWESPAWVGAAGAPTIGMGRAALGPIAAGRGAPAIGAKVARGALAPAEAVLEKAPAKALEYAIGKPLKWVAGKVKPKMPEILSDLRPMDEAIEAVTHPDVMRKLAHFPPLKESGISKALGGLGAVAEKPAERAMAGWYALRAETYGKVSGAMARVDRLGASNKLFGLADDGTIASGSLKGVHLNTIRTYPERYAAKLTAEQNTWVREMSLIEQAKRDLLERYGIKINELTFEEGGEYAGRRVLAKLSPQGELLDYAYVGAGMRRIGAKAPFERVRVFNTAEEGIKAGFRYLPEEEALRVNSIAAYNRISDKLMSEWLLERIPWRPSGWGSEAARIASEASASRLRKAKLLQQVLARAERGEKIPTQTVSSMERTFPEVRLREALTIGDKKSIKELKPLAKAILREQQADRNAILQASHRAVSPGFEETMIPQPAFAGKILTGPEAKETMRFVMREMDTGFSKALGAINQVNAIGRYYALAGDLSPMTIQLILASVAHPTAYAPAGLGLIRGIFDPKFLPNYLAKHAATVQSSPDLILTTATELTEAFVSRGLLMRWPLKPLGKALQPFARGFEASLTVAGIEMKEALAHLATTPAKRTELELYINAMRGLFSSARIGIPLKQRQWETLILLAPRYFRAVVTLLTDALKGGLRGSLARQGIAKSVSGLSAMAIAISLIRGETQEEAADHLNPNSPNFFTWQVEGQNIGPGSKLRSIIRLFAQSAENPDDLLKLSMENPALRFMRGNLAPAISTGTDLLVGEDYIGDPSRDGMLSFTRRVLGKNLLPIWVQSVLLEGGGDWLARSTRGAAEFLGMRGYEMMPWQRRNVLRDNLAQRVHGKPWAELSDLERLRLENSSPELQEITDKAEEKYTKMARGEGKVWTAWRADGEATEKTYQQSITLAAKEFEQIGDGRQFREKVNEAATIRRAQYESRRQKPEYEIIEQYFAEPLDEEAKADIHPMDLARREYYNLMFAPGMLDEFGNYKFDEADRREAQFIAQFGQEALDYVQEYSGARWDAPRAYKELRNAQKLLEPYREIDQQVWNQYSPELKQLSDQIYILDDRDPRLARQYLAQYPKILWARRQIEIKRRQLRLRYPEIARLLKLYY